MAKFQFTELIVQMVHIITARVGATANSAGHLTDDELGKAVTLAGDSQYDLATAGDNIEGFINSVQGATLDGWSIGSVVVGGRKQITFDGLELTPGTGVIAIGDYVNAGTMVAKDTALTDAAPQKVTTATTQANVSNSPFAWRVVSLGSAGTGAVGTLGIIERV